MTKSIQKFYINRVITYLTLSDVFTWGIVLVVNSLTGIYLEHKFGDSALEYIGIGIFILYVVKGITQVPIGAFADKIKTNRDEAIFLMSGNILMGFPFLMYPLITSPYHYYILQVMVGLGMSLNIVNWRKLFASHLDKGNEGVEYAIYDAVFSVSTAVLGILAGKISSMSDYLFSAVIVATGFLMICSSLFGYLVFQIESGKKSNVRTLPNFNLLNPSTPEVPTKTVRRHSKNKL